MLGNYRVALQLVAFRAVLSSIELVTVIIIIIIIIITSIITNATSVHSFITV
jgi:hypothetical protein